MRNLHKVLSVLFFMGSSFALQAQLTINKDSVTGQDVTGLQVIINATPSNNITIPYLYVTNTSGATQDWMVTRVIISQPADWYNYLCWGDLCYGESPSIIWRSDYSTLPDTESKKLSLYAGAPSLGTSHYRYYISADTINYIDSVDVILNITATVGVAEITNSDISIYPNPAKNKVTVRSISNSPFNVEVFDYAGHQVLSKSGLSINEIDVSSLSNGSYIFILTNKDTNEKMKKRIVISK